MTTKEVQEKNMKPLKNKLCDILSEFRRMGIQLGKSLFLCPLFEPLTVEACLNCLREAVLRHEEQEDLKKETKSNITKKIAITIKLMDYQEYKVFVVKSLKLMPRQIKKQFAEPNYNNQTNVPLKVFSLYHRVWK